jgi:hypothetical protein
MVAAYGMNSVECCRRRRHGGVTWILNIICSSFEWFQKKSRNRHFGRELGRLAPFLQLDDTTYRTGTQKSKNREWTDAVDGNKASGNGEKWLTDLINKNNSRHQRSIPHQRPFPRSILV